MKVRVQEVLFLSLAVAISFVSSVSAQDCAVLSDQISANVSQLKANTASQAYGNYFVYGSGSQLVLARLSADKKIEVVSSISRSGRLTSAFLGDKLLVAATQRSAVSNARYQSSSSQQSIRAYDLLTGAHNAEASFVDNTNDNLPDRSSYPFHASVGSSYPLEDWRSRYCDEDSTAQGQLGRLVGAVGSRAITANNVELSTDFCMPPICIDEPNPDYPNQPLIPTSRYPYRCMPLPRLDDEGVHIRDCNCRMEDVIDPDTGEPVLDDEGEVVQERVCELCWDPHKYKFEEHWWGAMNPGGRVFEQKQVLQSYGFQPQFQEVISNRDARLDELLEIAGDPSGQYFLISARLEVPSGTLDRPGGVFLFDADGRFRRFYSLFLNSAEFGSSIAALGEANGLPAFLVGAPGSAEYVDGNPFVGGVQGFFPQAGSALAFTVREGSEYEAVFYFGDNEGDGFGASVASAGDLDSDEYPDLAVGAPNGKYVVVKSFRYGSDLVRIESDQAEFGRGIAGLRSAGATRANALIVASNSALSVYDITACQQDPPQETEEDTPADDLSDDELREELQETLDAFESADPKELADGLGDFLDSVISLLRNLISQLGGGDNPASSLKILDIVSSAETSLGLSELIDYEAQLSKMRNKQVKFESRLDKLSGGKGKRKKKKRLRKKLRKNNKKALRTLEELYSRL